MSYGKITLTLIAQFDDDDSIGQNRYDHAHSARDIRANLHQIRSRISAFPTTSHRIDVELSTGDHVTGELQSIDIERWQPEENRTPTTVVPSLREVQVRPGRPREWYADRLTGDQILFLGKNGWEVRHRPGSGWTVLWPEAEVNGVAQGGGLKALVTRTLSPKRGSEVIT